MTGYCEFCEDLRPFDIAQRMGSNLEHVREVRSHGGEAVHVNFSCGHRGQLVVVPRQRG